MSSNPAENADLRTIFDFLEKCLARTGHLPAICIFGVEEESLSAFAAEQFLASIENGTRLVLLPVLHAADGSHPHPITLPSEFKPAAPAGALKMGVIDSTPQPSDGRWAVRIGSRGRLTLPEHLLYEMGWQQGDTLLFQGEGTACLSVRRAVRLTAGDSK